MWLKRNSQTKKNALEAKNLIRIVRGNTTIDALTYSMVEGEVSSLLGLNGAGKETSKPQWRREVWGEGSGDLHILSFNTCN